MIIIVDGDLLKSDCDIIAHQCNCLLAFGSGIAGQIRSKLPGAYKEFKEDYREPLEKLGSFCVANKDIGNFKAIYNLYGQYSYGIGTRQTDYLALRQALTAMMKDIDDNDVSRTAKIGIPCYMGCGLGGGDWDLVQSMVKEISDRFSRDIYIYKLQ